MMRTASRGGGSSRSRQQSSHATNENDLMSVEGTEIEMSSGKVMIYPSGDSFEPEEVVRDIAPIIKAKFDDGDWHSWKMVTMETRDLWFDEFKKKYCWLPQHSVAIKKNFESKGAARLKDMLSEIRRKGRDSWMSEGVYNKLLTYWKSAEFKKKSDQGKKNRASEDGLGPTLHTGGSIPSSVHKKRLEKTQGKEISALELFRHTHQKKDKTWVDSRSSQAFENHSKSWSEVQSTQVGSEDGGDKESFPKLTETELWAKENITKKGYIYGLGAEGKKYKRSISSHSCASSSNVQMIPSEKEKRMTMEIENLTRKNAKAEKKIKLMGKKVNKMMKMMKTMKATTKKKTKAPSSQSSKILHDDRDEDNTSN